MKGSGRWKCLGLLGLSLLFVLSWSWWGGGSGEARGRSSGGGGWSLVGGAGSGGQGLVQASEGGGVFNASQAQGLLTSLCRLYTKGVVAGDYCNRLCFYPSHKILDYRSNGKQVLSLLLGGQKTILKSRHPGWEDYHHLAESVSQREFEELVVERVNAELGLGWPQIRSRQLLELLWPPFSRQHRMSASERASLWTLLSQAEFLTFAVLPLARVFPKVMGSCGHFYVVQALVPFKLKSYYSSLRAKILVHLMGTLKLFYEFLNEPLHWCDVSFENLGLSAEYPKRFLVMDGDGVATETRLNQVFAGLSCEKDGDCVWGDCQAACNVTSRRCGERRNDNVGVFCSKLVHELFGSFWSSRNRYLAACHATKVSNAQRLRELRLVWAWSLADV